MQEIFNEIKQNEREGQELVDRTKKECEEKIILTEKNLHEKYHAAVVSFQKEAEEIFLNKKKEIEDKVRVKLKMAEKERNLVVEKAKLGFQKACEAVKKKIWL